MASNNPPLVARSNDGSLIGIHQNDPSSTSKTGLIRCYDGNVSNGSLKFTLRFPLLSSSSDDDDDLPSGVPGGEQKDELAKLIFASGTSQSPSFLCGMRQSSSSILIWDLDRGVLAKTLDVRTAAAATPSKKKKRKSSFSGAGNEVLCDVATVGNSLYALVFFPDENDGSGGKCRLYQYELSSNDVTLVKKIKVGSVTSNSEEEGGESKFGVAISNSTIVIRMNSQLRVLDMTTGDKLCKMDIPSEVTSSNNNGEEDGSKFVPLSITADGRYIVTCMNNQAILFSCTKDGDKHSLKTMALLSGKDDSPIANLELTVADKEVALVTFQPVARIASLFTISTKKGSSTLVPQMPQAQLQTSENDKSLSFIGAGFHPRTPTESLLLLFQRAKRGGGSAAGSGTNLPMESLSYADSDTLEGNVTVGTSLSVEDGKGKDKKRKAAENVALAPGDQGQEASLASDLTLKKKKKAKTSDDAEAGEDEDEFDMDEEDGEQGQSIAERLALLSSAMEQTDEEDDEDDDDDEDEAKPADSSKFKLKSATSETLTTLLTQALSSNDSSQLNIALQVTDRRLVEGTVRALQSIDAQRATDVDANTALTTGYIPTLMAHIVRRMARRHSLVMPLGVWVKAILAVTARASTNQALGGNGNSAVEARMAKEGREMAMKLGPLKNFLNERVECFPQLLRLEGRLALLSQQL